MRFAIDTTVTEGDTTVVRLDTRHADLGRDLRRLFAPILDAAVPSEIEALAVMLEDRLPDAARPRD